MKKYYHVQDHIPVNHHGLAMKVYIKYFDAEPINVSPRNHFAKKYNEVCEICGNI